MTEISIVLVVCLLLTLAHHHQPQPFRVAALGANRPAHRRRSGRQPRRLVLVVIGCALALTAGVLPASIVAAAYLARRRLRIVLVQRRAAAQMHRAFPDFVDLLVLTVRAGRSPLQAFEVLQPSVDVSIRSALSATVARVQRGDRFADALGELADRTGEPGRSVASALALADRYGTPLAPVLDRLATDAKATRRRQAEAAARRLPVLLSFPLVTCTLPSFVLLTIVPLLAGTLSSLRDITS